MVLQFGLRATTGICLLALAGAAPCNAELPLQHDGFLLVSVTFPSEKSVRRNQDMLFSDVDASENRDTNESKPSIEDALGGIALLDDSRPRFMTLFAVPGGEVTDFSTMSVKQLWVAPIIHAERERTPPAGGSFERAQLREDLLAVTHEDGKTWHVFRGEQWAVLCRDRDLLENQAASLIAFANQAEATDWPIHRLHVEEVPDAWRESLGHLSDEIRSGRHPLSRRLDHPLLAEWLRAVTFDCTTVSMQVHPAPGDAGRTFDFRFHAASDTPLARTIERLRTRVSPFARLAEDARQLDRWLTVHVSLPRFAVVRQVLQPLDVEYQFLGSKTLRTTRLSDNPLNNPLYDFDGAVQEALDATMNRSEYDLLISVESENDGRPRDYVAAIGIAGDPRRIERAFLDVAAAAAGGPAEGELSAHVKKLQDTSIHSFPGASDSQGNQRTEYFAVTDNVIFAASGMDWIEQALTGAMEQRTEGSARIAPIMISGDAAVIGGLLERQSSASAWQQGAVNAWSEGGRFTLEVLPDADSLVIRVTVDDEVGDNLMTIGQEFLAPYIAGARNGQSPTDADQR